MIFRTSVAGPHQFAPKRPYAIQHRGLFRKEAIHLWWVALKVVAHSAFQSVLNGVSGLPHPPFDFPSLLVFLEEYTSASLSLCVTNFHCF